MLAKREFDGQYFKDWDAKYETILNSTASEEEKDK
jgi:hypothetical protein